MKPSTGQVAFGASVAAVVTVVVAGLSLIGSPMEERARLVDRRRVADLQAIAAAVDLYWTRHSRLPVSLDALTGEPGVRINTGDPASSEIYNYQPADSASYELCASFEQASSDTLHAFTTNLWAHGPGRQCFRLEAAEVRRSK